MSFVWCKACAIRPAMLNEARCEDCWASDQARYDQRRVANINTMAQSSREVCGVPVHAETRAARRGRTQGR